jgi:diadenosine tetraphosphatase ApaH/serine/threonine PP2A family protein phosphatase
MIAVVSDIHGNLEALTAVLADAKRHGAEAIYNLGDLVGYGPNPVECVEAAMGWEVNVQGNFDLDLWFEDVSYPAGAWRTMQAARRQLEAAFGDRGWEFFQQMKVKQTEGDFLFVHGSPRNPKHEYVFPEDTYNQRKMTRIGDLIEKYCLCGHTHVPGLFVQTDAGNWEYADPMDGCPIRRLDGRKTIVNVGSVGQPRDGDWRACYVLLDGWDVTFRRVEYDVEATIRKMHAIPELERFLGDRLREGR